MFVQNLNRIVRKPNVTPRQFPYCTTDTIPMDLMFQEILLYIILLTIKKQNVYLKMFTNNVFTIVN